MDVLIDFACSLYTQTIYNINETLHFYEFANFKRALYKILSSMHWIFFKLITGKECVSLFQF